MISVVEKPLITQYPHLKCHQQINSYKAYHLRALERIIELDQKHKSDLVRSNKSCNGKKARKYGFGH